uniref:Estrogen receptor 2 n=1 Tax=Petromyzon marinus TaxID=7757 RepID=S4RW05_PETMA
ATQLCSVCGDFSSGYHYGVWTCEGCKAFFKRSVQGKNNFVCPATNHCTIDKTRRRRCQACRLRKCYEAGMIRDGCHSRDRILLCMVIKSLKQLEKNASHGIRNTTSAQTPTGYRGFKSDARRGGIRSFGGAVPHAHVEGMGIIHILLEAEPPKLLCMRSPGEPLTEASMMTLFTDLATKEMVHIVSWAKKIPGFMELDLPVKIQLLENSWVEVLITGLIWRSMEQQDTLVFASDLVFTRADGSRMEGTMEIFDQVLAIVTHFRELCLRMEEYACLKAMVLLNVDWMLTEQPDAIKAVCKIMDTVSNALVSFLEHSCLSEGQQFHRLTRLLMLLSHIHQIS